MALWKRLTAWVYPAPLLAALLWGGIYPGAKLALRDMSPLSFTALRLVLAAMLLLALAARERSSRPVTRRWAVWLNAGLAQAAFQGLLIASLARTTAGNSAIVLATAPVLTAAWLAVAVRERLRRRQWWGLLLGVLGVGLVVQGGGVRLPTAHLAGDLLALAAAAAWVWYGLAVVPLVAAVGPLRATAGTVTAAACVYVPVMIAAGGPPCQRVSWEVWAGLVYGAIVGMVVAMTLWGRSIHRLGPRQTMIYIYAEPVSAVIIAALILGESFGLVQAAGAALAMAGVWLAS